MAVCTPINLGGGTTPSSPCTRLGVDPLSVEWCTAFDVIRLFSALRAERNALVSLLNAFNRMVGEGKAKWTAATEAAWDLQATALHTIQQIPGENLWDVTVNTTTPAQAAYTLAQRAAECHAAACDVAAAIESAGGTVPAPAPPPKEPLGVADTLVEFGERAATAVFYLAGGAVVAALAYGFVRRRA